MEQLVSNPAYVRSIQAERCGEPFQPELLARGRIPIFHALAKWFINLALDRDYTELLV